MKPTQRFTRLRQQATLQEFVSSGVDGRGQPTGSWSDIDTVPIHLSPLNGRTVEVAKQLYSAAEFEIVARYRSDITRANRLVVGSRTMEIGYVENVNERGAWLRLLCREDV